MYHCCMQWMDQSSDNKERLRRYIAKGSHEEPSSGSIGWLSTSDSKVSKTLIIIFFTKNKKKK